MPEVVVVGAGVIGASVAWHLRGLGVRDVLLLDRAAGPAQGSTGRATGGFRAQYGTEINVRLSLLSISSFLSFAMDHYHGSMVYGIRSACSALSTASNRCRLPEQTAPVRKKRNDSLLVGAASTWASTRRWTRRSSSTSVMP